MKNKNIPIARQLSKFVVGTRYPRLAPEVVNQTKRVILDSLGCIIGARNLPSTDSMLRMVSELGGNGESTVMGHGLRTNCAVAALANGTMGHSLEMDDLHKEGTVHPSVVIIPSAIAVGEKHRITGKRLLESVAVGYDTMIRVGQAFLGKLYFQNFHPTSVCGVFGAAAAAGKALDLGEAEMVNAFGIAGSQASGLREARAAGTWGKRFQAGHAAMCGVISSGLARNNFTGPETIFEGRDGFFRAYSYKGEYDLAKIGENLGEKWELLNVAFKVHACCRHCAPIIDTVLQITKENPVRAEDVESIHVGTYQTGIDAIARPENRKYRPETVVDAQFSLPYCAALALSKGRAFIQEFTEESIKDEKILDVASRVTWNLDEEAERKYPKCFSAVVKIKKYGGEELQARLDYPKGDLENPATDDELFAKFLGLAGEIIGNRKCEQIKSAVFSLEQMKDIRELTELLRDK